MNRPSKEVLDEVCKTFVDKGMLIEAGWRSYELSVLDPDAPDIQRKETRIAFFAGAQHLFGSIIGIMDQDREPTENDLRRMSQINDELNNFLTAFKLSHGIPL